ncbi:MAG TPA: aspartate 1-decarboxylase [Thermoanaerobaculia bacterium]|jgi:aspartate 1-decarboxylase
MISLARSIIRGATVTHGDARDALRLDPVLLRSAEIRPFEEVEIVNLTTGTRLRTWVEEAAEASGEVHAPGARAGDHITIAAYTLLHEGQTLAHKMKVVSVDPTNRVVAITE